MYPALLLTVATLLAVPAFAQEKSPSVNPYAHETKAQHDARMAWWREAKFGLFIHWGIYAVPAGVYKDKPIGGIGEWIMNDAKIPMATYQAYAKEFNPVKYNPDAWVAAAKDAGMRYLVITTKHHDGFALFDTKASDWSVVKATPYGKDLIKPLADACHREGIHLGFYYSQAQDWNNGGSARKRWDKAQEHDMADYIEKIVVPQVREILSNYGKVDVIWWDTPVEMTKEFADKILPLLSLQPGVIHNNRLGGGYKGDTETPEQHIPANGYPRDWETCMTMNGTWGFKRNDLNWKSTKVLLTNLVDIISKGGNYLLNVGPTAEGEIPQASLDRLKEIGTWMRTNGTAIYGTTASVFKTTPWGRSSTKRSGEKTTVNLMVLDWPKNGSLSVGLANKVISAELLGVGPLKTESKDGTLTLSLPSKAPDAICSVISVTIEGEPTGSQVGKAEVVAKAPEAKKVPAKK